MVHAVQLRDGLVAFIQKHESVVGQVIQQGGRRFTRQAAGAPLLVLQFDGHGNDAGYLTRCEAFLDSKGILRCYQDPTANDSRATVTTTR